MEIEANARRVDVDLWRAFKVRCIQRGVKIRATLTELIREYLKKTEK